MKKARFGYLIIFLVLSGLLFFTSRAFFAVMIFVLLGFGMLSGMLVYQDAAGLYVTMKTASGAREGGSILLTFCISSENKIFAGRKVLLDVDIINTMFQSCERRRFSILLHEKQTEFTVPLAVSECGKTEIICRTAALQDVFGLFRREILMPKTVSAVVYPHGLNVKFFLSNSAMGAAKNDGLLQNRKGTDHSEMFDIRDYVPGDDFRSIHWKLSSKTENLIIRQPSDPAHYDIVIMPDLGMDQLAAENGREKVNFIIGLCVAMGEQLLKQGMPFCVAAPAEKGLQIFEITGEKSFRKMTSEWLSISLPEHSGIGLQYFSVNHMEQYFSRLLILSAGTYAENVQALNGQIGVTVLNASEEPEMRHTKLGPAYDHFELPVHDYRKETYQIIC